MSVIQSPQSRSHSYAPPPRGWVDQLARAALVRGLGQLTTGAIQLIDDGDSQTGVCQTFGAAGNEPAVTVRVVDPAFYRRVLWAGSLGAAEAYLDGLWSCDDLVGLFRLLAHTEQGGGQFDGPATRLAAALRRLTHLGRRNTRRGSRRNIEAHYDLGNDFFALLLDSTMTYSGGIFESPGSTLRQASLAKYARICRNLGLTANDEVLEIGGGWGGFAEYAARQYGCRVTTTTISHEQFEFACKRIEAAGLTDRVTVLKRDYRDLTGSFDKLVSIEMIEAVGHDFLDDYFRQVGRLLRPHGTMVLQGIVMPDFRYRQYLRSVDFIQRYIFPGGCLPSLGAITQSLGRTTALRVVQLDDLAAHYAQTLACWSQRFEENLGAVRELGYSARFVRTWRYYLAYCEAAFAERAIGLVQMTLAGPGCRHDPLRTAPVTPRLQTQTARP